MASARWLDEDEARAWRGYQRMRTLLTPQLARALSRDAGLSEPDYTVLSNLSEADGHRWLVSDLAARMLWSPSRLSHHIARMQARGLVEREPSRADARRVFVRLTPAGLRAIEDAAPAHVASVRRHLVDLLTRQQIRTLGDIAETVVAHLNGIDETRDGDAASE